MAGFEDALTEERRGILIAIEVTAGAKTGQFPSGYNEWRRAIGCRVAAPAIGGRANKAVISLLSQTLGVPASSVSIASGATSSQKKILVTGITRADATGHLKGLM